MQTSYIKVDPANPEAAAIERAASIIKKQGLVAFPTETVYGLGADAYSATAVGKIFAAKNRPASTPLLVHVCNLEQAREAVTELPEAALGLMQQFWPGPLSLILPADPGIPAIVTAGRSSVGLRMPSHPVALALLACSGPLAAPSANLSGRPSPVTPEQVRADLDGRIEGLLDAGPTGSGIESTVLDLSTHPYQILRRGGVPIEALEAALGQSLKIEAAQSEHTLHYQVKTRVIVARDTQDFTCQVDKWAEAGPTGAVVYNNTLEPNSNGISRIYELDLSGRQGSLYTILRDAEAQHLQALIFSPLPAASTGVTAAIIDRIHQAAAQAISPDEKEKGVL